VEAPREERRRAKSATPPELWREPERGAKISFPLRNRFIQEHKPVKLMVTVDGLPLPEVRWLKDGKDITSLTKDYNIAYTCGVAALEIYNASTQDSGRYTLETWNSKGKDESTCKLVIEEARWKKMEGFMPRSSRVSFSDEQHSSRSYSLTASNGVTSSERRSSFSTQRRVETSTRSSNVEVKRSANR